ncbi:unnamed protein product, partial [Oikopleura dioica]
AAKKYWTEMEDDGFGFIIIKKSKFYGKYNFSLSLIFISSTLVTEITTFRSRKRNYMQILTSGERLLCSTASSTSTKSRKTSLPADLGNGRLDNGKRGSMTKEQMMKLNTRRKSMILMVNQEKMNSSDHRRDSLQAAGAPQPRGRRFAILAKKASIMSSAFK